MRTVVLVPRRGGGIRDTIWKYVYPTIKDLGYPVYVADSDGPVFAICQAWNNAARDAGDWDQAIFHIADQYLATPDSIHAAVASDHPGVRWGWDRQIRLGRHGTRQFFKGKRTGWVEPELRRRQLPYPLDWPADTFEGPKVVSRDLWEQVGEFPEEFVGFGGDDLLFAALSSRIHPPVRFKGILIDLWHEKASDMPEDDPYFSMWHDGTNQALYEKYSGEAMPPMPDYITAEEVLEGVTWS